MGRPEENWGTWRVPYGKVVRIQRVRDPREFSDERSRVTLDVPGNSGEATGAVEFAAARRRRAWRSCFVRSRALTYLPRATAAAPCAGEQHIVSQLTNDESDLRHARQSRLPPRR